MPIIEDGNFYPSRFAFGIEEADNVDEGLCQVDSGVFDALGDTQVMVRTSAVKLISTSLKRLKGKEEVESLLRSLIKALGGASNASSSDGLLSAINVVLPYPPPSTLSRPLLDKLAKSVVPTLSSEASTVRQGGANIIGVLGWR